MISICIPVYNYNVLDLVSKLELQSEKLDIPSEIILIDDCSDESFKKLNRIEGAKVKYIELNRNIGRAAIRNKFPEHCKYENLLFLDCDSEIIKNDFLQEYVKEIRNNPGRIICGGRVYSPEKPNRNKMLRWKYGIKKESKAFELRRENPNRSFMTNNFLITRNILKRIPFDESLVDYGHEDTLLGIELRKNNIEILHIDNPVLNGHLEDNAEYLFKTEIAISNLLKILGTNRYNKELIEDVSLLKAYHRFKKLRFLTKITFNLLQSPIKHLLSRGYINLCLFDFYKLGILTKKID